MIIFCDLKQGCLISYKESDFKENNHKKKLEVIGIENESCIGHALVSNYTVILEPAFH